MPIYAYKGLNDAGHEISGLIDAESAQSARVSLRRTGIFPTAINEEQHRANTAQSADSLGWRGGRVSTQELALLTRQFATLAKAGLPLLECLDTLIEQMERAPVKRVLSHVRQHVREGRSLADALAVHPRIFSLIYVNMVRAGEESGTMETVLERLAEYGEGQARLLRTVRSALAYPVLMMVIAAAILLFLLAYVVPQVTRLFSETGQTLPLATRVLIGLSSFVAASWWVWLLLGAAGVLGGMRLLRTPGGRRGYDRLVLGMPWVGHVVGRLNIARFARTLSTLLASGVPLLSALGIVSHLLNNSLLREALEEARRSVLEGGSLAAPLKRSGVFPPLLTQMIGVGERSGDLENMLRYAAEAYDEEVATALSRLTTLLEPVTIVLMGGVVLFIVLAILLPIFDLNQLAR
jgi:general secretion pathway protein F